MERVLPISIDRERRKSQDIPCTPEELTKYRSLEGMLDLAGRAAITVACFIEIEMQLKLSNARVEHLCSASGMLAKIQKLNLCIL